VRTRWVIGAVCVAVGAVWFGQGVGWIGGSFMSGEGVWAVIGIVTMAFGAFVARGPRRVHESERDDA
jgi:hypothetical protein